MIIQLIINWCFCIIGPIPFFVVGEIFRQEPRSAAMSLSLCFNWVCNFILMLVFRFMQVYMLMVFMLTEF